MNTTEFYTKAYQLVRKARDSGIPEDEIMDEFRTAVRIQYRKD